MPETFFFFFFCVDVFLISYSISSDLLYIDDQELKLQGKGKSYDTNHLGIELIYQTFLFHWAEKIYPRCSLNLVCHWMYVWLQTNVTLVRHFGHSYNDLCYNWVFLCVYFQLIFPVFIKTNWVVINWERNNRRRKLKTGLGRKKGTH